MTELSNRRSVPNNNEVFAEIHRRSGPELNRNNADLIMNYSGSQGEEDDEEDNEAYQNLRLTLSNESGRNNNIQSYNVQRRNMDFGGGNESSGFFGSFLERIFSRFGRMAKYKRAELTEEDDSVHLDHLKTHVLPIQPPGMWSSRTSLEKLLLFLSAFLLLSVGITSVLLLSSWRTEYILQVEHRDHRGESCLTPTCVKLSANMLTSMDSSVDPCQDFYQYACGGWIRENPIPEGKSSWGTFQKLWQQNQLVIKIALEESKASNLSEAEDKARRYYQSCMDKNETQEKLGAEPLIQLLQKIGGWSISPSGFNLSSWAFQTQLQVLHNDYNMGGFFAWAVGEDDRNSSTHIIQLDQGGLTLPTKEFYLNKTHEGVRKVYLDYMIKIAMLLGAKNDSQTQNYMEGILAFETEIANITAPADERRDDEKLYHPYNLTELQVLAPEISWREYFNSAFEKTNRTINNEDVVVVYAPEFLSNMSKLIASKVNNSEGKIILNNYLVWHTVKTMTCCLSKPFKDAEKLLRKAILGSDGMDEQWRTCVSDTNNNLGFAVGAMFIRDAFHPEAKPMAQKMIEKIRQAFQGNLKHLGWMDDETRELAKDKAAAITDMIGYPEFILSGEQLDKKYEGLEIKNDEYFKNNLRVSQFSLTKNLEKLDQPVNKTKWGMTPPTVNAYYSPTSNQMVIPAGILQRPFFDPEFPKAINFGAIGVVFSHELTHAFDDQGREYDKFGNLRMWWRNATIERFKNETECIVSQYSGYKIEGERVNGRQTLGENIADNGGLKAAFHAYQTTRQGDGRDLPLPGLNNITDDQLFFISFAQVWCSASLRETLLLQLDNDPHVPAPLRVKGPLSNLPEFARTFSCPKDSQMNPHKKCTVW